MSTLKYLALRTLLIFPVLVLISLSIFFIKVAIPVDAADLFVDASDLLTTKQTDYNQLQQAKMTWRTRHGLDLPVFYLTVQSAALPEDLYKIFPKYERDKVKRWSLYYGQPEMVSRLWEDLAALSVRPASQNVQESNALVNQLAQLSSPADLDTFAENAMNNANPSPELREVVKTYELLEANRQAYYRLLPRVVWHGTRNQFHHWFSGLLQFNLGKSYVNNEPVSQRIWAAMGHTLMISLSAVVIIFLLALPLGAYLSGYESPRNRVIATILYFFDAMPLFWIAILLMVLLASNSFFNWFPTTYSPGSSGLSIGNRLYYLFLPVLSLVIAGLPYVTLQVRQTLNEEGSKPYVLAARAKGLSEVRIMWHHQLRNGLIPIITLFSSYLNLAVGGSLIVEAIYSVPGMGWLLFNAVGNKDYPVVLGVILVLASFKMISNLLADVGYKLVDPNIQY